MNKERDGKKIKYQREVLWHVELWSFLLPYDNIVEESGNESLILRIYEQLVEKKIEFPINNLK